MLTDQPRAVFVEKQGALQRTVNAFRNGLAIAAAPFIVLYNNFRENYAFFMQKTHSPWAFAAVLTFIILPLFFINWARVYGDVKARDALKGRDLEDEKKQSKVIKALRLVGAVLYSIVATSAIISGIGYFLYTMGTSLRMLPIVSGIVVGVMGLVNLLYAHNEIKSWKWKNTKGDFQALWNDNIAGKDKKLGRTKNLGKNLGALFGHLVSLVAVALFTVGMAMAFTFFGLPGMIIGGVVAGVVLLFDFNSFLPAFYKRTAESIKFTCQDLAFSFGLSKTKPVSAAQLHVNELVEKLKGKNLDDCKTDAERKEHELDLIDLENAQNTLKQENAWNNARVLRYVLYTLGTALAIVTSIMSAGLFPAALGVVAAVVAGILSFAGYNLTLKAIASRFLGSSEDKDLSQAETAAGQKSSGEAISLSADTKNESVAAGKAVLTQMRTATAPKLAANDDKAANATKDATVSFAPA